MAEISSFPNNSDEYQGAGEVMRWLHGRTKGVYAGEGNAAVSAITDTMQVSVAPGIGWITNSDGDGICWWFDTAITLAVDPAESTGTLNRIDRVILEWQTTDYAALPEVKILKGQNRSTAVAPSLTNTTTLRQMSLAQISIPAGTTKLTALNITDERMDETVCGIVTETVTADTSMIAAQYEAAIEELRNAISQAWSGEISDGAISTNKIADAAVTADKIDSSVLLAIYPVGSIYMSVNDTSPASFFGGTWERIKDRFLLSAGDTYAAGSVGGEATHMLTGDESGQKALSISGGGHSHTVTYHFKTQSVSSGSGTSLALGDGSGDRTNLGVATIASNTGTHSHSVSASNAAEAHNNMPPYVAVYVWKRVS